MFRLHAYETLGPREPFAHALGATMRRYINCPSHMQYMPQHMHLKWRPSSRNAPPSIRAAWQPASEVGRPAEGQRAGCERSRKRNANRKVTTFWPRLRHHIALKPQHMTIRGCHEHRRQGGARQPRERLSWRQSEGSHRGPPWFFLVSPEGFCGEACASHYRPYTAPGLE